MTAPKRPDHVLPENPAYRPLERFWPYADLPESPTPEELARVYPELREAVFGGTPLPFSMSLVFPAFDGPAYAKAVAAAKGSDEYVEFVRDGQLHHRARFFPSDRPLRMRDLWELINRQNGVEVLVDDRAVPYARELWLPLVWFLI